MFVFMLNHPWVVVGTVVVIAIVAVLLVWEASKDLFTEDNETEERECLP